MGIVQDTSEAEGEGGAQPLTISSRCSIQATLPVIVAEARHLKCELDLHQKKDVSVEVILEVQLFRPWRNTLKLAVTFKRPFNG